MSERPKAFNAFETLRTAIENRKAVAGVMGLGYVGLPLAIAIAKAGFHAIGFDTDPDKPEKLSAGVSYIGAVRNDVLARVLGEKRFRATSDFLALAECDAIVICVPTPLLPDREPDLSYVKSTAREIARHLRPGQLVVLESTSYPGTTRELVKPILESSKLRSGEDFFLGFSPEREDPGNPLYGTVDIPKIVSGDGARAAELMNLFYGAIVKEIVPVSSMDVAEAAKITENIFRAVNIALVNELKVVYERMGIDIWEVIEAAKTKPFGYMPFYPGPGLGGHCIPIDPFYLSWKSRRFGLPTRFIELAGEINISMPDYVVGVLTKELQERSGIGLKGTRVLLVGLAYKKNVADVRESPAFRLLDILERQGARVEFHDPLATVVPPTREHPQYAGQRSISLSPRALHDSDAVLICTDHDTVDYRLIHDNAKLIVDTRNVMGRKGFAGPNVVKA
jgi:UDP-N-acetyl-D-glucosamine dehydrogenase